MSNTACNATVQYTLLLRSFLGGHACAFGGLTGVQEKNRKMFLMDIYQNFALINMRATILKFNGVTFCKSMFSEQQRFYMTFLTETVK